MESWLQSIRIRRHLLGILTEYLTNNDNLYSPPSGRETITIYTVQSVHEINIMRSYKYIITQAIVDHKFLITLFIQYARQCKFELSAAVVYYINIICPKQFHKKTIDNKVYELLSDLHNGHASKPYSNIGIHFVRTICKITSSDAHPSIFLNIALAALSEHLKDRELTM